ncbi:MAG: ATP-binding cassette, subfamily bacterial [Chthoniobacter sp.]|nr:ATP-binding cassette, subfamily bacterial [Chthoniobacter sp.]
MTSAAKTRERYAYVLRYARPYWRGWLLLTTVTLLNVPFALLQPWPMKLLVDNVLGDVPRSAGLTHWLSFLPAADTATGLLGWIVFSGILVFALNSVSDILLTFGWVRVGQRMVYDFALDLFANVQRRSMVFHTKHSVGDLMSRITYDTWCVNTITDTLLLKPLTVVLTMASMIFVMARIDGTLTLLSVVITPFMAGSSFLLGRPVRTAARASREIAGRMQAHVQQTLSGIPVVQAFAQEDREHQRFLEYAGAAVRAEQRNTVMSNIYNLSSGLLVTLGTAVILWLGASHVLAGWLTVGTLLVFLSYLASLNGQFRALTDVYRALQSTGAGMDRAMEIRESKEGAMQDSGAAILPPVRGRVAIENVTFGYDAERPSLRDVSLLAEPGETIAVVGETGAGKSTLVSLIPRFVDPWSGRVTIDGHDLREVQVRSLRSQIAVVLQEPFLFPMSIAGNIAFGRPGATRAEIEEAARMANAERFIERLPAGYETVIGERGGTLSGGERQRLSIARALLKNAPVLVLDEPTSALDAETESLLLEALERLMKGRTTFIVAHRLSTIRNADRIVAMRDGRIAESGSHAELMERGGVYANLYGLQFGSSK